MLATWQYIPSFDFLREMLGKVIATGIVGCITTLILVVIWAVGDFWLMPEFMLPCTIVGKDSYWTFPQTKIYALRIDVSGTNRQVEADETIFAAAKKGMTVTAFCTRGRFTNRLYARKVLMHS